MDMASFSYESVPRVRTVPTRHAGPSTAEKLAVPTAFSALVLPGTAWRRTRHALMAYAIADDWISRGVIVDHQTVTITRWTGLEAKLLRQSLRLTVTDFAALLGVNPRTVNKWEARCTRITPLPEMQSALDTALRHAEADVADRFRELRDREGPHQAPEPEAEQVHPPEVELAQLGEFIGEDMASRRTFLNLTLLTGAALVIPVRQWAASTPLTSLAPGKVGAEEIDGLERAVELFRHWDASGHGGLHRKAVVGQLHGVIDAIQHRRPASERRRLFTIAAELSQLVGWMTYDASLPANAQRYFLFALRACEQATDVELGAKIVGDMAQLSKSLGNYDDSLGLVRTALATLPRTANPLVRAELLGHEACTYARFGSEDATSTRRSVDAAMDAFDQVAQGDHRSWNRYMDRAELDSLAASAYIQLALGEERSTSSATEAEHHAVNAARARPAHRVRSRLFDDVRLSKVRLAQREVEESTELADRALTRAMAISSPQAIHRLRVHSQTLTAGYGDLAVVRAFSARLSEHLHQSEQKVSDVHA
ncbi:hypothetical protein GCM10027271_21600 [Saccharopolyspora gloriosae]